jgi:hypothetical protein
MSKPETLKEGMSQLLVEGVDAKYFCIWACKAYKLEHIQVQDFGGIKDLDNFLSLITVLPNYKKVPAILIVRDAETNAESAIQSIKNSLERNNFCVPEEPYSYCSGNPSIEFAILPGDIDSDGKYFSGALEDLCMLTITPDSILKHVDEFLKTVQKEEKLTHFHKSRLHSYLAVKNKFVGMKIGEAAKAGAWNWEHPAFSKLRKAMLDIEKAALSAIEK